MCERTGYSRAAYELADIAGVEPVRLEKGAFRLARSSGTRTPLHRRYRWEALVTQDGTVELKATLGADHADAVILALTEVADAQDREGKTAA